ncbi:MAG: RIP metalloprotease RseP [Schwartzia sp.]|nr:RIP metalloprotease RseP [Schwartzia sp. (in: firmicutes)]
MLLTILASVFVFGLLVLFHELGHFLMAKLTGMRVDEFAIGFGPTLCRYQYGETVYSIRAIPLGGFNDIAGMDPADNDAGERGYCAKPLRQRLLVIVAGPLMNFLLPVVIFFGLYLAVGVTSPSDRPELGDILPDKPAAAAGLRKGDVVTRMNGQATESWNDIVRIILDGGTNPIKVEFRRDGEDRQATLIPVYDQATKRPLVGIMSSVDTRQPGVGEAAFLALRKTGIVIYKMIAGLWSMITGEAAAEFAGPLGVAQMAGEVAQIGFAALMNFAALLSLNLGIINLLPVPALDGGHVMTLLLEGLRGKPLGAKALQYTQMAGVTLLIMLMLFATKNDIVRIFFGN